MSMKYISDTQENKTFPNYVFRSDITEYTATYMVITSSDEHRRFNKNEFTQWKFGQHLVKIKPNKDKSDCIISEVRQRALDCAKGTDYYHNVHIMVFPGFHPNKIDNILREELYPAISKVVYPEYKSYYSWRQLKKLVESGNADEYDVKLYENSGKPTELAYHVSKVPLEIMNDLVDLYVHSYDHERLDDVYLKVKSSKEVQAALNKLKILTENAKDTNPVKTPKSIHTSNTKQFSLTSYAYKKFFSEELSPYESCAIFSSSIPDAIKIAEIYSEKVKSLTVYCMEHLMKGNIINRWNISNVNVKIRVVELTEHNSERYDRIIAHMPVNGNMGNKILKLIIERFTKPDSKLNIITDSSLVHTYPITYNVQTSISEKYAIVGEKSSFREIEKIHQILEGHINYVILENFNQYSKNSACISMMNIKADFGKNVSDFVFMCHGEKRICKSLRECIEFGTPVNFIRIMRRLLENFPRLNISNKKCGCMLSYPYFIPAPQKIYCKNRASSLSDFYTDGMKTWLFCPLYNIKNSEILEADRLQKMQDNYKQFTQYIHGTKEELYNYKKNCTTDIMKYISIMLSCVNARTNVYMDLIPFVADRVYTNKELRNKVGISDSEMTEIKTVIQEAKLKEEMIENIEFGVPIIS